MKLVKKAAVVAGVVASFAVANVNATSIGYAVGGIGESDQVGGTRSGRHAFDGQEAIRYFIPLSRSQTGCTFGVDCGTSADRGRGGQEVSLYLRFDGVSSTQDSVLNVVFEDLDLNGASDSRFFSESLEVFDHNQQSLTGLISSLRAPSVTGDTTKQELNLLLGTLVDQPLFLELRFAARSAFTGRNTAEYLRASVSAVPLPATAVLFGSALLGLAGLRRRKLQVTS